MKWRVKPNAKIKHILVLPDTVEDRFDYKNWSGDICSINHVHPKAALAVFTADAPQPDGACTIYSSDPDDAPRVGIRMVEGLSEDPLLAALTVCTRLDPEEIVVLDSDFNDGGCVINANPLTGGVDPRAYGITPPGDYPEYNHASVVSAGYHSIPHLSDGGRAWIIGGGPSLEELDTNAIPEEDLVVGCNDACRLDRVHICCFHDKRWGQCHEDWLNDPKVRFFTSGSMHHPNVRRIQQSGKNFSTNPTQVTFASNTGMMALNFAYLAGAREIVLLGFDMQSDNGRTNWHDQNINAPKPHHYATYIQRARDVAAAIARDCPDLKVVNLNPNSAMDAFEKQWPSDYMPGLIRRELFE